MQGTGGLAAPAQARGKEIHRFTDWHMEDFKKHCWNDGRLDRTTIHVRNRLSPFRKAEDIQKLLFGVCLYCKTSSTRTARSSITGEKNNTFLGQLHDMSKRASSVAHIMKLPRMGAEHAKKTAAASNKKTAAACPVSPRSSRACGG